MALSPSDVEQKTFSTALRGYDLDEVDDFLDEIVATLRDLNDQIASGGTAPAPLPVETAETGTVPATDESAVGRALVAAQETADRIVAEARMEADQIIEGARSEADTLVSEKEKRKAGAEAEMAELAGHVAGVRSQLAFLATAVADRLDEMDAAIGSQPGSLDQPVERSIEEEEGAPGELEAEDTDDAVETPSDDDGVEEFALDDSADDSEDEDDDGDDDEPGKSGWESGY